MSDPPRRLPPLAALRAAESAARTGSIAAAARELGVSSAAVSQQLALLEAQLNRRLFERGRHGVTPTAAGSAVLPHLSEGFASLARIAEVVGDAHAPGRIAISAPATAAFKWLPQVVPELQAEGAGYRMDFRIEDDPVDFGAGGPDLRITYGDLPYAGLDRAKLVDDALVPLCAPGFNADWRPQALIHTDWGASYARPPTWRDWAGLAGLDPPDLRIGHRTNATAISLDMAARGQGIALANALYAYQDLREGRLTIPFGPTVPLPAAYTLYYHPRRPQVAALARELSRAAQRDVAAVLAMAAEGGAPAAQPPF
jgi:LysR family glycine cleavage system transcriptional activator